MPKESALRINKCDDTQGNFLSNVAGQYERLLLGHIPIENGQYISIWII